MEIKITNAISLKVLTEWPLSKVELVSIGGKTYILKTVHSDFTNEAQRQQLLSNLLTHPLTVPQVFDVLRTDTETKILMEYIEGTEPSGDDALHVIGLFHDQTQNTHSDYFPSYNYEHFLSDYEKVKELIPEACVSDFKDVFNTETSIVHGDWKHSQLMKVNDTYCIFDFGRSFYGPSLLDYGYYFKDEAGAGLEHFGTNKHLFLKAKLVTLIMQLEWFVRCRDNYISYDYNKEISETQSKMEAVTALQNNEESTLC